MREDWPAPEEAQPSHRTKYLFKKHAHKLGGIQVKVQRVVVVEGGLIFARWAPWRAGSQLTVLEKSCCK